MGHNHQAVFGIPALLAMAFLGFSALAGGLLLREVRVAQFWAGGGAVPVVALSLEADFLLLNGCLRQLGSVEGRLLAKPARATLLGDCLARAEVISQSAGKEGFGWAVLAYLRRESGDRIGYEAALRHSYIVASNESWISALRLRLVSEEGGQLSGVVRQGYIADLVLLMQSLRMRLMVVRRYVALESFRAVVAEALPALPEERQREFLSLLRQEVRAAAPEADHG
ncbi:MAG: hypothetical protein L3J37_04360 [Rhodobacteraceae bacterium]|nr:hypothetical protein [Paracoccaceae bacterium]